MNSEITRFSLYREKKAKECGRTPHTTGRPPILEPSLIPVLIQRIRQKVLLKQQVTAAFLLEMVFNIYFF
jgi:hypothetical protein